jgi:transcriptional regulator with XRE-family HTH domain
MNAKRRNGFPSRLKVARAAAGLTQRDVAEQLRPAVHPATVGHWEGGRFKPSVEHVAALATLLGVRFAWLAVGEGEMRDA